MRLNAYNGDRHLRIDQGAAYLLLNAVDNALPMAMVDDGLRLARLACPTAADEIGARSDTPSPSRALCDLFWAHLPWTALGRALGPIHMIDLGCGSGAYAARFRAWSGGAVQRYTGVDIQAHPNWTTDTDGFADFQAANIERPAAFLRPTMNLIVSQSTLEHVENEAAALDAIDAFARAQQRPVLQLHAIPSAACLRLYLWHGYRQYTPRRVSQLTARFADAAERRLVALGGDLCNRLHWRFITWPVMIRRGRDRRDADPAAYRRALAAAVRRDLQRHSRSPSFYVLALFTNGGEQLPAADCWRSGNDG